MGGMIRTAKDLLPKEIRKCVLQFRYSMMTGLAQVEARSRFTNIYHCCVQKTASQWLRRLFADPALYRYSGLRWHHFPAWMDTSTRRPIVRSPPPGGFPEGRIVSPLYIDYPTFRSMPKPLEFRAFFVKRDPRDIVVSFYFSTLHAHLRNEYIASTKEKLEAGSKQAGMVAAIDELEAFLFPSLRSWERAAESDASVSIWRFEDLTNPDNRYEPVRALLDELDVRIPTAVFDDLMSRYAFQKLSGRSKGEEDRQSSFRKGVHGDWRQHFTPDLKEYFEVKTDGIHRKLGYSQSSG